MQRYLGPIALMTHDDRVIQAGVVITVACRVNQ